MAVQRLDDLLGVEYENMAIVPAWLAPSVRWGKNEKVAIHSARFAVVVSRC